MQQCKYLWKKCLTFCYPMLINTQIHLLFLLSAYSLYIPASFTSVLFLISHRKKSSLLFRISYVEASGPQSLKSHLISIESFRAVDYHKYAVQTPFLQPEIPCGIDHVGQHVIRDGLRYRGGLQLCRQEHDNNEDDYSEFGLRPLSI